MRKTDINQYKGVPIPNKHHDNKGNTEAAKFIVARAFKTTMAILIASFVIIMSFTAIFTVQSMRNTLGVDLRSLKLNLTSFIYVGDDNDNWSQYQSVNSSQKRVWVNYDKMPQSMKNAMVAIEDKRFYSHHGVDVKRTLGATFNYVLGKGGFGGSTITQQLIKNITNKKEVSLTRKFVEIVTALALEQNYTKDEILEAYLNIVNFGSGCNGVEAAANLYFGKSISECSIAECASIAGITQNPTAYTPLVYPEANKTRQQTVLMEMYNQGMITKQEYDKALAESENMHFVGKENAKSNQDINNWYMEAMLNDLTTDLSQAKNIDKKTAQYMLMYGGYKIYSAMDVNAQNKAESVIADDKYSVLPKDQKIQVGYFMMDYDGRVLASVGQRGQKQANMLWDCANIAKRQPGSSIKPISVYAPALQNKLISYSSIIKDQPLTNVAGQDGTWPPNWYSGYRGDMLVPKAIEISSNAVSAQVLNMLTLQKSYDFLTQKLGFSNLSADVDMTYSGLATGGGYNGVTVREMTAAFQIFGKQGEYNKPFMYYYVEDSQGNIVLDNRNKENIKAISADDSTIMRHLLYNVVTGSEGTGRAAAISGCDVFGKTGTTNENENSWFVGGTPYAVAGIWTGYETPKTIKDTAAAIRIWRTVMEQYVKDKKVKSFTDSSGVLVREFCTSSGKLASDGCPSTGTGYYTLSNIPGYCTIHSSPILREENTSKADSSSSESRSSKPSSSSSVSSSTSSQSVSSQTSSASSR